MRDEICARCGHPQKHHDPKCFGISRITRDHCPCTDFRPKPDTDGGVKDGDSDLLPHERQLCYSKWTEYRDAVGMDEIAPDLSSFRAGFIANRAGGGDADSRAMEIDGLVNLIARKCEWPESHLRTWLETLWDSAREYQVKYPKPATPSTGGDATGAGEEENESKSLGK